MHRRWPWIHDLEVLPEDVEVGQAGVLFRLGSSIGSRSYTPSTLVALRMASALISIARSAARYRREIRVPGPRREDHHAPLFKVAQGAPADVRLGDRAHLDRAQNAGRHAGPLEESCRARLLMTVASIPM